jgi:tRNA threonylcarbamoyladenosine biosynthesis protein TsaB
LKLLAIDTSTRSTVLGLLVDGELTDRTSEPAKTHSREILPSIESLVAAGNVSLGDLDAIVFGQGPGSFTGLRIAVGIVQGLGYGLSIPVVPVSTMACLAQSLAEEGEGKCIAVALSARLEEVYFGSYVIKNGIATSLGAELVADAGLLPVQDAGDWYGLGDGWVLKDKLSASLAINPTEIDMNVVPRVSDLLTLGCNYLEQGKTVSAMEATPVYLREEVASKPGQNNGAV